MSIWQKVVVRSAGLSALLLSIGWAQVALFTDFREHHHPYMLIAAALSAGLAFGLFWLNRWAVAVSWLGAAALGAFSLWLQITGGFFDSFLALIIAVAALYMVGLLTCIRALTKRSMGRRLRGAPELES